MWHPVTGISHVPTCMSLCMCIHDTFLGVSAGCSSVSLCLRVCVVVSTQMHEWAFCVIAQTHVHTYSQTGKTHTEYGTQKVTMAWLWNLKRKSIIWNRAWQICVQMIAPERRNIQRIRKKCTHCVCICVYTKCHWNVNASNVNYIFKKKKKFLQWKDV